jgi:2'-5' RNA ligase
MSEQLGLPGFDVPPQQPQNKKASPKPQRGLRPKHNYFFAFVPPQEVAARIAAVREELRRQHGLAGDLVEADRLHVTLYDLGGGDEPMHQAAIHAALAAAATLASPAFEMRFDHAMSFPHSRAFVLGGDVANAGVAEVRQQLKLALKPAGFPSPHSGAAHMTLLYGEPLVPRQAIAPIGWEAGEFVLVHSRLRERHYEWLGRWPLRAGG